MKPKKLLCILFCLIFFTAGKVCAEETSITAEARYLNSDTIIISGNVTNPKDDLISLVFGDINTLLYIDQTDIVNGAFSFTISLSDKVPVYEYPYILGTESAQYKGTLRTRGKEYNLGIVRPVIEADIDFTVSNYVPTFSGTATCGPAKEVNVNIYNKTTGATVINDTIDRSDGEYTFSYTLPRLSNSYEYSVLITAVDGENELVSANLDVKTSLLTIAFAGPIAVKNDCKLVVRVKSVNTNLLDKTMSISEYPWTTDFQIPNILANCQYKITAKIYQGVSGTTDGTVTYLLNPKLYDALKAVKPHLDPENTGVITTEELSALTGTLDLSNFGINSIDGLQNCTGITNLYINNNSISDISPLLTLNNLRYLDASNNKISKLYRIPPYLKLLNLAGNSIVDISAMNHTDTIVHFNASDNKISNINPLSRYKRLRYLDIRNNRITDMSPLPKVRYVRRLLSGNQ